METLEKRAEKLKEKKCSLMAGQYFDIKVEHIDITAYQFAEQISHFEAILSESFDASKVLEQQIKEQIGALKYE
jgi:type I restriction enzyme M protein